jgi:1-deoxy-D-xylulose-5-phosphate reductoisomerase
LKNLSILGSTGSIGTQTLDIVSRFPDKFRVIGLCAGKNVKTLAKQIKNFKPEIVSVFDKETAEELALIINDKKTEIVYGKDGALKVATKSNSDMVVSAMVGAAGLEPTIAAIRKSKDIALANKETLVMAGKIITEEARNNKVNILPVDSEHSAIFQSLNGSRPDYLKRIIITASGGPFLHATLNELSNISVKSALNHPTWKMGKKITIDSSTLMNKCFEVIEARWLFDISSDMISVWIHPQSIIHSIVEFIDGSMISQMSLPDMRIPIAYALTYPERLNLDSKSVNPNNYNKLEFMEVDTKKFPSLNLAYRVLKEEGTLSAVMNAANEVAVNAFLEGKISFNNIVKTIVRVMDCHTNIKDCNLQQILSADLWSREKTKELISN